MQVELRLFAAARAAAGTGSLAVSLDDGATIRDAIDEASRTRPDLGSVAARCSFLLDGIASEPGAILTAGSVVDVLPPFAGG